MVNLTDLIEQEPSAELFSKYRAPDGSVLDEAFEADGTARPHWRGFLEWLSATGGPGYMEAGRDLTRLRVESGVAFSPNGAAGAEDIEVQVHRDIRTAQAEAREVFVEAVLTVEASGRPRVAAS